MSENLPHQSIVLYIWPSKWGLPSFEPLCLAAVLYVQLAIPGKFSVVETANPDSSPSGQLPYLVHGQHVVSTLPSIIKYVSDLRNAEHSQYPHANLDLHLTAVQRSQRTAWFARVESQLGNLLAYALYYTNDNWIKMTEPSLAFMYPVPQRYYAAQRIRNSYHPKLQAAKLGNLMQKSDLPFKKDKVNLREHRVITLPFEREKISAKVKAEFDLYLALLSDDKSYVFGKAPTSLDVLIAAHLLLILKPPYFDPQLKSILQESYPSLASYAQHIYDIAFASGEPIVRQASTVSSLRALLPTCPKKPKSKKAPSPEDVHFSRMRWAFFGLVGGAFAAYFGVVSRDIEIRWVTADDEEGIDEEGGDDVDQ